MAQLGNTKIFGDLAVNGEILNKASTVSEGVVKLSNVFNSTSTTEAPTANALNAAYIALLSEIDVRKKITINVWT